MEAIALKVKPTFGQLSRTILSANEASEDQSRWRLILSSLGRDGWRLILGSLGSDGVLFWAVLGAIASHSG